jgi:hypothetical protein
MDSSIHRIRNEERITKSKGSNIIGKSPTNITTDKEIASRMANLLEGLEFPATKAKIKDHINKKKRKFKVMKNDRIIIETVSQAIQNNLQE